TDRSSFIEYRRLMPPERQYQAPGANTREARFPALGTMLLLCRGQTRDFAHAGEGAAHMWNRDRATHNQRDIERVDHLFALPAFLSTPHQMIGDAVIAA